VPELVVIVVNLVSGGTLQAPLLFKNQFVVAGVNVAI
jgi:hypothetical protein